MRPLLVVIIFSLAMPVTSQCLSKWKELLKPIGKPIAESFLVDRESSNIDKPVGLAYNIMVNMCTDLAPLEEKQELKQMLRNYFNSQKDSPLKRMFDDLWRTIFDPKIQQQQQHDQSSYKLWDFSLLKSMKKIVHSIFKETSVCLQLLEREKADYSVLLSPTTVQLLEPKRRTYTDYEVSSEVEAISLLFQPGFEVIHTPTAWGVNINTSFDISRVTLHDGYAFVRICRNVPESYDRTNMGHDQENGVCPAKKYNVLEIMIPCEVGSCKEEDIVRKMDVVKVRFNKTMEAAMARKELVLDPPTIGDTVLSSPRLLEI